MYPQSPGTLGRPGYLAGVAIRQISDVARARGRDSSFDGGIRFLAGLDPLWRGSSGLGTTVASGVPLSVPALNSPAQRSGAAKSKEEEQGAGARTAEGAGIGGEVREACAIAHANSITANPAGCNSDVRLPAVNPKGG